VPVIVNVYEPAGVLGLVVLVVEQPAKTRQISRAPAKTSRRLFRRAASKAKNRMNARDKSISGVDMGGIRQRARGATNAVDVTITVVDPGAVTADDGGTQLPCGIVPEHARVTAPVKPPRAFTVTGMEAVVPRVADIVAGTVRLKSQPVPLKARVCGLFAALSVSVRVPVRGSFTVELGAKVTAMVQVPFTATVTPLQVLVCAKSLEMPTAEAPNVKEALPLFVTVTV
jgi:hypothetical protein